jgi:hypothetical protein
MPVFGGQHNSGEDWIYANPERNFPNHFTTRIPDDRDLQLAPAGKSLRPLPNDSQRCNLRSTASLSRDFLVESRIKQGSNLLC